MTPKFRVVGDHLQEQPRMKRPETIRGARGVAHMTSKKYEQADRDYWAHLYSLRRYTIRPSDWEGITEVNEGEFEVKRQRLVDKTNWEDASEWLYEILKPEYRRLLAVPLRPAGKGQEAFSLRWSREQFDNNQTKYYHQRAKWISSCIESGFADKDQIEALEKIWDDFKKPL